MSRPKVLIVGGGFAGLACANSLDAERFAVTLVDRKADFEFLPNIHELLSGVKKPSQLRLSLRAAMRAVGHRFIRGDVTGIDPEARCVQLGTDKQLCADYLVIALGSADADYGVSGVGKHSYGFKSVAQCQAIHERLQGLSRKGGKVVIIGGGLEGVEALGEVLRRYRHKPLQLTLVEARHSLLPAAPAAVGEHLADHCREWDVSCITGDPVARITAKTVTLNSGRRLRSDLTVWTGGPVPPALLGESGLAKRNRWAAVDPTLAHSSYEHVFIAGDAAELEQPISKQAYHALDMGRCIAANIERLSKGKAPRRFKPSGKPTLLAFGDVDSVLISDRVCLAGPPLAAAKEAVFAAVMPQLDLRPARHRLESALGRSKQATQQLLWPTISNWRELRRQTKVQKLT
ncbi:HI0933-like protein [gamma proteobacterium NOR5-3]|nr:HI0933-like protein [gamma proteobacterium NOR5-3]